MAYKLPSELVSSKTFPKITINIKQNSRINWFLANGTQEQYKSILFESICYVKMMGIDVIQKHGKQESGKNPKIKVQMNLNNDNKVIKSFMNGSKLDYLDMLQHVLEYVNRED